MFAIDPRTIIFLAGALGGLMGLVMFFLRRSYPPSIRGLGTWSLAMLLLFVTGVLASLRNHLPVLFTVALPNLLIMLGTYGLYLGSQQFFGAAVRWRPHLGLILALNAALLWFLYGQPLYGLRLSIVACYLGFIFSVHAALIARYSNGHFSSRFAVFVLVAGTVSQGMRLLTLLGSPAGSGLLDQTPQNTVYVVVYPVIMLLLSVALVLLATDRLRQELEHMASHDPLTHARTRGHMNDRLSGELARSRRHGQPLAALLMDLDHFKAINDRHGHLAGDLALVDFVRLVQQQLRHSDVLGRFGGEEFLALLPHTDAQQACAVAERIRAACAEQQRAVAFTVSIGVAAAEPDNDSVDDLLARCDAALYQAKAQGRNRVVLATRDTPFPYENGTPPA
ncbi:MAG: GGDEF domain-containing protein [Rhodoferax sp.]